MAPTQTFEHDNRPNGNRRSRLTSIVNCVLFVVFAVGAIVAFRSGTQSHQLTREYQQLMKRFGDLEVTDPDTIYIRAIQEDEPWSYAWRVYLPKSLDGNVSYALGESSTSESGFSGAERDFIARLSLYPVVQSDNIALYFRFAEGSSLSSFASTRFLNFLEANKDKLTIHQLATDHTVAIKRSELKVLFQIVMSDELAEEARQQFPDGNHRPLIPVVAEFKINVR